MNNNKVLNNVCKKRDLLLQEKELEIVKYKEIVRKLTDKEVATNRIKGMQKKGFDTHLRIKFLKRDIEKLNKEIGCYMPPVKKDTSLSDIINKMNRKNNKEVIKW